MSKKFSANEQKIRDLLDVGSNFILNDKIYSVVMVGKPGCKKGEPKTDIYVKAKLKDSDIEIELKISFKQKNADFIENKINSERAKQILGDEWRSKICDGLKIILDKFESSYLIYKKDYKKTNKGSITLGWKFELLNKLSGNLSGGIELTEEQVMDVYAGTNLSKDKKDATVCNQVIINSGIANYILIEGDFESTQDVVDKLIPIKAYVKKYPKVYFACKALNYRMIQNKYDGNRPLSVYVNWYVSKGKLCSEIIYDKPLVYGGDMVFDKLKIALEEINISDIDDISLDKILKWNKIVCK